MWAWLFAPGSDSVCPGGLFSPEEEAHGIHAGDIETSILLGGAPRRVRNDRVRDFLPSRLLWKRNSSGCAWLGRQVSGGPGKLLSDRSEFKADSVARVL